MGRKLFGKSDARLAGCCRSSEFATVLRKDCSSHSFRRQSNVDFLRTGDLGRCVSPRPPPHFSSPVSLDRSISVRLNGKYAGTGFTHVPGGEQYCDRSVLSYHYYCIILSLVPVPGNETIPIYDRLVCDDVEGPALFRSVQVDLTQLGGSAFLTEFGGCDESPTCDEQLDWGLDAADQYLQSWAYWGDVLGRAPTIKRLARIYARAIAGKPLAMQYASSQRTFYLSYYVDPDVKQPTEVVVPVQQFPAGSYNITVNAALKWRQDPTDANIILVEPSQSVVKGELADPSIGIFQIRPKAS